MPRSCLKISVDPNCLTKILKLKKKDNCRSIKILPSMFRVDIFPVLETV